MELFELEYNDNYITKSSQNETPTKKISFIYVDSRLRNTNESNILDTKVLYLESNALKFTSNSSLLTIQIPNQPFNVNDLVILDNCTSSSWTNTFTLTLVGSKLFISSSPNYPESSNTIEYLKDNYTDNTYISISNLQADLTPSATINLRYVLGKVPINIFKSRLKLEYDQDQQSIYIDLGTKYFNTNTTTEKFFTITLLNIAGIPLSEINANYPLDEDHNKGAHIIHGVGSNHITIKLNYTAIATMTSNCKNMVLCKVVNRLTAYTEPSSFEYPLDKTFTTVRSLRVISSEIPYTIKNINTTNNVFYWSNQKYSKDKVNRITLEQGCYTETEIFDLLLTELNKYGDNLVFSGVIKNFYFEIQCFTIFELYQPFIEDSTSTATTFGLRRLIQLKLSNHNLNTGDEIVIEGATSFKGIPANILNNKFTVEVVDDNILRIDLGNFNIESSTTTIQDLGGSSVKVKVVNPIRIENLPNNIYKVLGISQSNTSFNTILKNNSPIKATVAPYIKLLCFPNSVNDNQGWSNVLTCFRFDGTVRGYLYDTFTPTRMIFNPPLKSLSKLYFEFLGADDILTDFSSFDNSFCIELIEEVYETKKIESITTPEIIYQKK